MKKLTENISKLLIRAVLICNSILILFPLIWVFYTSFKSNREFYKSAWAMPEVWQFVNYQTAWVESNISGYFFTSAILTLTVVFVLAILAASTSYVATRFKFRKGEALVSLYMAGMMVPTILGVIPTFLVLKYLKMLNSFIGLGLVYIAYGLPFSVFVMAGYFRTIPHEIEEAAMIDGCNLNRLFWEIMIPMAKPGLVTICIFNFIAFWNEYILASTYMTDPAKRTLAVGLKNLMSITQYETKWGALFAAVIIVMVPTVIVYAIFQKKITGGLTSGALKG